MTAGEFSGTYNAFVFSGQITGKGGQFVLDVIDPPDHARLVGILPLGQGALIDQHGQAILSCAVVFPAPAN